MSNVTVEFSTRQQVRFDLEELEIAFQDEYEESQARQENDEDFVRRIITEYGFDYLTEFDFISASYADEFEFDVDID